MAAKIVCADPAFWRAHIKAAMLEEKLSVVCFRSVVSPLPKKVYNSIFLTNICEFLQCADRIAPSQRRPSLSANLFCVSEPSNGLSEAADHCGRQWRE